jgi:conjugal transfer pilus assembly protein TraD
MRWWDAGVRVRAGLVAANALALAWAAEGPLRWAASALGAGALVLIARSLRRRGEPGPVTLARTPAREGALFAGRGFEWTVDAAQETVESGREAARGESELWLPDRLLDQHVLVAGATGSGKSRLLEVLALQAVARGDAVAVFDPKGDEGLLRRLREAAGARFRLFSLPHPGKSVRYNPIGRYRDVREVADRVAALLPSSGDALPFRNFGWEIVDATARALDGKKPVTFRALRRHAIDRPIGPLAERPREHYLKTASALIPLLSKLSSDLLSPASGGLSWDEADRERLVVYFELGCLLAPETAAAVAKAALLDLQSYVGARYADGVPRRPIWLFVDELGDVATEAFVHLLNKSRGAGLRVVACLQTAGDLEAALGSEARAMQVLGNASTVVQFRAPGERDAEVFSRLSGARLLRLTSEGASYEPALFASGFRDVDDFRARFGETSDWKEHALVPPWTLVQLPVFHYFARFEGRVVRGRVPVLP